MGNIWILPHVSIQFPVIVAFTHKKRVIWRVFHSAFYEKSAKLNRCTYIPNTYHMYDNRATVRACLKCLCLNNILIESIDFWYKFSKRKKKIIQFIHTHRHTHTCIERNMYVCFFVCLLHICKKKEDLVPSSHWGRRAVGQSLSRWQQRQSVNSLIPIEHHWKMYENEFIYSTGVNCTNLSELFFFSVRDLCFGYFAQFWNDLFLDFRWFIYVVLCSFCLLKLSFFCSFGGKKKLLGCWECFTFFFG